MGFYQLWSQKITEEKMTHRAAPFFIPGFSQQKKSPHSPQQRIVMMGPPEILSKD